jgi:tRNA dimethylallyltransferase
MKPRVVIILGPTAVGKSEVAMRVALKTGAEIVNADSQQVYRHMDIGTWKPSRDARRQVVHHLVDLVNPDEEFNAALFREAALEVIRDIQTKQKRALVCGGSGLYIKALTQGIFIGPSRNDEVRAGMEREAKAAGTHSLHRRLKCIDPEAASAIHPNDLQRTIRALEVFFLTGRKLSLWQKEHGFRESWCTCLKIGLARERAELYGLINRRCEEMVSLGFVDEVKALVSRGYDFSLKPMQSIGYRHAGLYVRGGVSLQEALELMKRDTRRFAKRQLTWFRSDHEVQWFHPERDLDHILDAVTSFWS